MDRIDSLAPSQKRKLYELCWQFEDAWIQDHSVTPESWMSKVEGINSEIVLADLTETRDELEMRARSERQLNPTDAQRYEFVEEIARGGAAVVWRVKDHHLQRQSAVKYLLDSHDNTEMRSRLRREARICAKLVHPGIVPIYELSSFVDGRPFVCMKLIEGKTLLQLFKESPPVPIDTLLEIFTKACQAIAFAHQQNIIHRDLSPSNIMVGLFGEVQIMDWGLAKDLASDRHDSGFEWTLPSNVLPTDPKKTHAMEPSTMGFGGEMTSVGSVFGTIAYLSPEQASGRVEEIDKRSDVFSLGSILCRILTGAPPYQNENREVLLQDAQNANLLSAISRLKKSKYSLLSDLAIRCMSERQASRPNDASKIVSEIERIRATTKRRKAVLQFSMIALAIVAIAAYPISRSNYPSVVTPNVPSNSLAEREASEPITDLDAIRSLVASGKRDVVLKSYHATLEAKPNDHALHSLICAELINVFRFRESEVVARKTVAIMPSFDMYQLMLSDTQFYCGRIEESIASLEVAKQLHHSNLSNAQKIEESLARRKRLMQLSIEQSSSEGPIDCDAQDIHDFAKLCQYQDKFELAAAYYNKELAIEPDDVKRSFLRFHLLNGFVRHVLSRQDLDVSQRNLLHTVGLEWMSQQVEFALQDPAVALENSDPKDREQQLAIKRDLLIDLKERESMRTIQAAVNDPKIDPDLKNRYELLLKRIQSAK